MMAYPTHFKGFFTFMYNSPEFYLLKNIQYNINELEKAPFIVLDNLKSCVMFGAQHLLFTGSFEC